MYVYLFFVQFEAWPAHLVICCMLLVRTRCSYIHNIVWILALTVECQLQHYTGRYEYTKVKCNCTETVGFLLDGGLVLHCIPLCYMIAHNAPIQFNAVAWASTTSVYVQDNSRTWDQGGHAWKSGDGDQVEALAAEMLSWVINPAATLPMSPTTHA